jgi:hypothetical protein
MYQDVLGDMTVVGEAVGMQQEAAIAKVITSPFFSSSIIEEIRLKMLSSFYVLLV